MVLLASSPVRFEPYFGYRSRDRLVLTARALRAPPPDFDVRSRMRRLRTMIAQFASHEAAGVEVRLEYARGDGGAPLTQQNTTDGEGYAHFDLPLEACALPHHPRWESARLHWINADGPQSVEATILAPGSQGDLAVISDIDDTIIETGVTGGIRNVVRNWRRLLAELPHERLVAPQAPGFYSELGGGTAHHEPSVRGGAAADRLAPRRPFFYVSSSPWNLFNYLVAFQRSKQLPLGPLLLRDWGFDRRTLGSASHGAHKRAAIEDILAMYPEFRFALIGDDTQGDLPAFADIVARHPDRVAAVFLRMISDHALSPEERTAKQTIAAAGVPLWLGDCYGAGREFLRTLGFTPGGETEQIVRTVDRPGDPAGR